MSKKQIIVLVFIVLAFLGLVFFLSVKEKKEEEQYFYLFTGDNSIVRWYYNQDKWYIVNTNEKLSDEFEVYSNGKYQGNYNLVFNNKWYYFDSNNESKKFEGINFMINTNYDFKSYEFRIDSINDNLLIEQVSKKINIVNDEYDANLKKAVVYDNENFKDVYFVDYYKKQNEYNHLGPNYTVAFVEKSDTIEIIKILNFDDDDYESCSLNLAGVFKFNNDNNKLLLTCVHFDQIPSDYYLYEYRGNKYNLLIEGNGGV